MAVDDELSRAFATLTDRLHDEIGRQIQQTAATVAIRVRSAVDRTAAETRDAINRDADARMQSGLAELKERAMQSALAEVNARAQAEATRRTEAVESIPPTDGAPGDATNDRLAHAIRALDDARSLGEILDTLARTAAREAGRAAVLFLDGGGLVGWRFVGFDPSFDAPDRITVARSEASVITEAIRSGMLVSARASKVPAPTFARLPNGSDSVAVPIVLGGQPVAVLYADPGSTGREGHEAPEGQKGRDEPKAMERRAPVLETLTRHAARCLESITALRAARLTVIDDVSPEQHARRAATRI